MFILAMGVVCRRENGEWVKRIVDGVWSAGTSLLRGSRGLLAECGLSGQVWRVGQENCWRSVVCRGEIAEWVKKIVGGVWSVGAKRASGSRGLLAECGLSGQVCCVGQRNWRRRVVCRRKFVAWVKRIVGACGLSGQVWRVGQENCWRSVVCRDKYGEWVKGIVDGVWSVGSSLLRGSKELSAGCGLSAQVWRVGQEACRWYVVCRGENVAWVKGIVGECGLSGRKGRVGQKNCRRSVVCRGEKGEWVKRPVGGVWSVGTSLLRGSKELSAGCGLSGRKCCVGQRDCR